MKRWLIWAALCGALFLSGCLVTVNEPLSMSGGESAVFLGNEGSYILFAEEATLHLLRGGDWVPVPAARIEEAGGLLDVSPDGRRLLYVDVRAGETFASFVSTLYITEAEPEALPEPVFETGEVIAKAVWIAEDRILLLLFGEGDLGTLGILHPTTGEIERLREDVLSFAYETETETIDVLGLDEDGELLAGYVERWPSGHEVAAFVFSEQTVEMYLLLPHQFLWNVSPDGRWVAISVFDADALEPATEDELPDLYLVDTLEETASRIAVGALMPRFSPDNRSLLYLSSDDDGATAAVTILDLPSGTAQRIRESLGLSAAFWFDERYLGLTYELDDDRARIDRLDLETGEVTPWLVRSAE